MMNPVPWLQMTNMISYQGLVRTFLSCTGYQQGRNYRCQNFALHHYLLPSFIFFYEHLPLPSISFVNKNLQNY
ncbi:hypothetical protein ACI8EP_24110, partial [Klebsiella michiganensis]